MRAVAMFRWNGDENYSNRRRDLLRVKKPLKPAKSSSCAVFVAKLAHNTFNLAEKPIEK